MNFFTRKLLLFFVFSASVFSAKAQLTAHFTASTTSGCAPLVVYFTNTSTGTTGSTIYNWDSGDGATSGSPGLFSATYLSPGTYTARLTLTDGGVTSTTTLTITVYPNPIISFIASDSTVCPGTSVTFTSTTIPGAPGPMIYTWSFGDGNTGAGSPVTNTYTSPGYYRVILNGKNSNGCLGTLSIDSFIHVYDPPNVYFSPSSFVVCHPPGSVTFTDHTTGTPGFTYAWSFGDGGTSTLSNPTHMYSTPGSLTVGLTVTDGHGCVSSYTMPTPMYIGNLHASFTTTTTACVFNTVSFNNATTPTPGTSQWFFGDGGTSLAFNPTYVYGTPGIYTVTLVASYLGCLDTTTRTINIISRPPLSILINPMHPCPPPSAMTFSIPGAPSGSIVSWIFGNHTSGTGNPYTYTRPIRGIDTNYMFFYDPATGCRDSATIKDTVYDMMSSVIDTPASGCVPLTVHFIKDPIRGLLTSETDTTRGPGTYPFPITSYTWNYGDGSAPVSGTSSVHTYTAVGAYTAYGTFTTSNGCTFTDSMIILVGNSSVVTYSLTPAHICFRDTIMATITIDSGTVDHIVWNWGDGEIDSSSLSYITYYRFHNPGKFRPTIIPYYNGCPGRAIAISDSVLVDSPKAFFTDTFVCSPHDQVVFLDLSIGADSLIWFFGDGDTSTARYVAHTYSASALYQVNLAVYNARSGCRDTMHKEIDLTEPTVTLSTPRVAFCKDDTIRYTATTSSGGLGGFSWYKILHPASTRGDTIGMPGIWPSCCMAIDDTSTIRGIYDIMLVYYKYSGGIGCPDTAIYPNYITCAKPIANFSFTPPSGCWPLTANFTDHSTDVPGVSVTHYSWDFGDLGTASVGLPVVTHTYVAAGSYTITDTVTDNIGCKDTFSRGTITVYRPHAAMTPSTIFPCIGASMTFTNTSTGATSSSWDFGDGATSIATSPTHSYGAAGVYTIRLIVTDIHGCLDTATYISYITVSKPVASFYMDDSFAICPPLFVHFYNTSTGASTYGWDLGDGSTSTVINPSDLYTSSGAYHIMLIATNPYGCSDTAYGNANIYGYAGAFSYGPLSGCSPLTVHFHATIHNVPNIVWDFVDGTTFATSLSDSTTHTYTVPGAYLPRLILSDLTGCHNSSVGLDTIKVDAVVPGFTTVPNPVCLGGTINFLDTSRTYFSPINKWL